MWAFGCFKMQCLCKKWPFINGCLAGLDSFPFFQSIFGTRDQQHQFNEKSACQFAGKAKKHLTNNNKITNATIKLVARLNFCILSYFMGTCPQSHGPLSSAFPQSSLSLLKDRPNFTAALGRFSYSLSWRRKEGERPAQNNEFFQQTALGFVGTLQGLQLSPFF